MATRTVRLVGTAYAETGSVSVRAVYNGVEIHNGTVTTINQTPVPVIQPNTDPNWYQTLVEFESTTDITGELPCVLEVTGGTLFFAHFKTNYAGGLWEPNGSNTGWELVTPTASFFSDPNYNTVESDGINDPTIDGEPFEWRVNVGDQLGDWCYPVTNGQIMEFNFFVDPGKVKLTDVAPPWPPA